MSSGPRVRTPNNRPLKFVLVGLANTGAGLGTIYAAKYFFGAGDITANLLGYGLGLLLGFRLNASWTFVYQGSQLSAFALYLLAFLVSYAVNLGVVLLLIHGLGANSYLAQAAGIPFYALFFFITCQHFVFKESRDGSTALTP